MAFVLLMVGSIWWHPLAVAILFAVFTFIGLTEFVSMWRQQGHKVSPVSTIVQGMSVYLLVALYALQYISWHVVLLMPVFFLMPLFFNLFKTEKIQYVAIQMYATLYVAVPFALFNVVRNGQFADSQGGAKLLLAFFALVWTADTFAYLWGRALGRHALFPSVSPNKTWEGSIGGALTAIVLAASLGYMAADWPWWQWAITAAVVVVSAAYGDLVESQLKRQLKVKDSGSIMPGHGGVLDRFDAAIFAVPFYLVILVLS